MRNTIQASHPFYFYTRLHLSELTGIKAQNLEELVRHLKEVPGACIYHHTHHFLQQHQYLSPEPPNDFAYWVSEALEEEELGEKLASVDTFQFSSIRSLRERFAALIESYLREHESAKRKFANSGDEFHFIKSISFVLPTPFTVHNLKEFAEALEKVSIDSIYYHVFESRLRLERGVNDFSCWLESSLGEEELAGKIAGLDPYTHTMEGLRRAILGLVEKRF